MNTQNTKNEAAIEVNRANAKTRTYIASILDREIEATRKMCQEEAERYGMNRWDTDMRVVLWIDRAGRICDFGIYVGDVSFDSTHGDICIALVVSSDMSADDVAHVLCDAIGQMVTETEMEVR